MNQWIGYVVVGGVILVAIGVVLSGPGENWAEQTVRCQQQHVATFDACMGYSNYRAN